MKKGMSEVVRLQTDIELYCFKILSRSTAAEIQNRLLAKTIIVNVIHLEEEAFVVNNTGNIRNILENSSSYSTCMHLTSCSNHLNLEMKAEF